VTAKRPAQRPPQRFTFHIPKGEQLRDGTAERVEIEIIDDKGVSRIFSGCWVAKAGATQPRVPPDGRLYAGTLELSIEFDNFSFVDEKGNAQRAEEAREKERRVYGAADVEIDGIPYKGWRKVDGQRVRQQPRSQHVEEGFGHVDAPDPSDREVRERQERQDEEKARRREEQNQERQRREWERKQAAQAQREAPFDFEQFLRSFGYGFVDFGPFGPGSQRGTHGVPPRPTHPLEKWRQVLNNPVDLATAEAVYKKLTLERHPDRPGGSHEAMVELNNAIADARKVFRR